MISFRVWTRPLGDASQVCVEGSGNAHWLLGRLSRSFVFKSSAPVRDEIDSAFCTFQIPYGSQTSRSAIEKLLAVIPEVQLVAAPP
jgi:hypothetical protein